MNGYDLSRVFWDFAFENPERIKPYHVAIYFFAIEHCNRLGWKKKFGFPTSMVLESTGMKSYSSYKKYFDELVDFGFFVVHEYSKNQFSSNIIELSLKVKADTKALDKALSKHGSKQRQSTDQSNPSINKQQTTNKEPLNKKSEIPSFEDFKIHAQTKLSELGKKNLAAYDFAIKAKYEAWIENDWHDGKGNKILGWKSKLTNTVGYLQPTQTNENRTFTFNSPIL